MEGVGSRLKLTMPIAHARAVFRRLDVTSSGQLSYDDFIDGCQTLLMVRTFDWENMSNQDLLRVLSLRQKSMILAFEAMDLDKDARLSLSEARMRPVN